MTGLHGVEATEIPILFIYSVTLWKSVHSLSIELQNSVFSLKFHRKKRESSPESKPICVFGMDGHKGNGL